MTSPKSKEQVVPEGGWQPIETAPKDGTAFLARYQWAGNHRYLVIRRYQDHPWWISDHDAMIKHDDSKNKPRNFDFTHWQSITPPKVEEA